MNNEELERAWGLNQLGRHAEAEARVRAVLSTRPDDEWGLRLLASTLSAQDRLDEALEAAQEACRVAPDGSQAWIQLTFVRIRRFEPADAVAAAERAVACAPNSAAAHHALSRANQAQTERYRPSTAFDPERALSAADEAVRLSPGEVVYLNTRAWALVLLERRREAGRAYADVLAIAPDNYTAINALGWLNRDRRPIVAARHYASALALKPQSDIFKVNLVGALWCWIYRMLWIWLWGGLALGLLHPFVPDEFVVAGLAGLAATCVVGTVLILGTVPRGTLRIVLAAAQHSLVPLPIRLLGGVGVAVVAARATREISLAASLVLVVFMLFEWKVLAVVRPLWSRRRLRSSDDGSS